MPTKITKIDKKACREIGDGAAAALKAFAESLGLLIVPAGGQYSDGEFTAKFKFRVADPEAARAIAKKEWDENCRLFDLEPDDFGAKVKLANGLGEVVGIALNRPKYPIKVDLGGKVSLYTTDIVPRIKQARAGSLTQTNAPRQG